jgi:hypothetical protein
MDRIDRIKTFKISNLRVEILHILFILSIHVNYSADTGRDKPCPYRVGALAD